MDSPVTKLIFIAAAVAGAALVVTVMWATLSRNSVPQVSGVDFSKVASKQLCETLGGNWGTGTPKCTPSSTSTTVLYGG